jgi:type I thyroxine 5'-deiodinase
MSSNIRDSVILVDPKTLEERTAVAESCVRKLGIKIPALVDDLGDGVEKAYTGWPDRLYFIGRDGIVKFKSAPGPFGFHPAALEKAIAAHITIEEGKGNL